MLSTYLISVKDYEEYNRAKAYITIAAVEELPAYLIHRIPAIRTIAKEQLDYLVAIRRSIDELERNISHSRSV